MIPTIESRLVILSNKLGLMTIQEITDLRKSGRLQEACEAAEKEFSKYKNKYTAGALFWCLYEQCKKSGGNETILSTLQRMKNLSEFCPDDELMQNSLSNIEKLLDPISQELKSLRESAQKGQHIEAGLEKFIYLFKRGELEETLYPDLGWCMYYCLKFSPLTDANRRKKLLSHYLKLDLPRPNLLHSLILSEAIKVEKNTPSQFRLRDFMRLWGWGNFIEDDWKQYPTEKGHKPSRVESLIAVYAKELKTDKVAAPKEFTELVEEALPKFPNNQYMPLYKAYVLKSLGKNEEAINFYRDLIMKTPSKAFLWSQASDLTEDLDLKIALLCKAISTEKEESFIGGTRLKLIEALIKKGLFPQAKFELEKYKNLYLSKGWRLKYGYYKISRMIPSSTAASDSVGIFKESNPKAEEFVYSHLVSQLAIKISERQIEDRRRPGQKIFQITLKTAKAIYWLNNPGEIQAF